MSEGDQGHTQCMPLKLLEAIRPTTLIESKRLNDSLGIDLLIASEAFQHTGSFKFRAAYNLALNVPQERMITASSGNFGQALAYACKLLGKKCTVVMPDTSAAIKIEAVKEHGGRVETVSVATVSRAERVAELAAQDSDAYVASAYDDPLVIQGNASLGGELSRLGADIIVSPIGGGGLASGLISGLRGAGATSKVYGAEPLIANDAARSLREGRIVMNDTEPQSLADGARTISIGHHNWEILRDGLKGVVEVPEERIAEAVKVLFLRANLKVEPTGALSVAALLTDPEPFRGKRVCCIVSGGNVDPGVYAGLLVG